MQENSLNRFECNFKLSSAFDRLLHSIINNIYEDIITMQTDKKLANFISIYYYKIELKIIIINILMTKL